MAIETTFSIKQISVEQALKEAEAKVDASARKMDSSLNTVGGKGMEKSIQNAAKGMDAVQKAGGKVGGVLKNLAQGVTGLMSPIGMVSAGITAIIALTVKLYEAAKQRIQALKDYARIRISDADTRMEELLKEQATDRSYMQRLVEISKYETIDNATKEESIRIITMLTSKYGDLGLRIDETSGKVLNLVEAMDKFNKEQHFREGRENALVLEQHEGLIRAYDAEVRKASSGNILRNEREAIMNTFSPITMEEQAELNRAMYTRISYGRAGMTPPASEVATPLNDARLRRAESRAQRYFVDDLNDLDQYRKGDKTLDEMMRRLENLQKAIESGKLSKETRQAYEIEATHMDNLIRAWEKWKVADEMMTATQNNPELVKQWKDRRDAAIEYYKVLRRGIDIAVKGRPSTTNPNDELVKQRSDEAQELLKQQKSADKARADAYERKYNAEISTARNGMNKDELYESYTQENNNYLDQIMYEEQALDELKKQYEEMTEALKEYDKYKNEKGDIEDKAKNAEYLALSNKVLENKIQQAEMEASILDAQTAQLGVEARLKAMDEERAKAQREMLVERAKNTLKSLWSNVLGDMKERTNALTQRGGYLSNVNTINGLQVNRQILNTVITANNYLASIKQQLNNVGKI